MADIVNKLAEATQLSEMVEHFNKRVRGQDVPIDIVHDPNSGSAGWLTELKLAASTKDPEVQSLWGMPSWTTYGEELAGKEKKYNYLSAEFGQHQDAESKKLFDNVLIAVTLTNRPFVKWMRSIEESRDNDGWLEILREGAYYDYARWGDDPKVIKAAEIDRTGLVQRIQEAVIGFFTETPSKDGDRTEGGSPMDHSKILEILAAHNVELKEDATEDEVLTALSELLTAKDGKITELEEAPAVVIEPEVLTKEKEQLSETNTQLSEQVTNLSTKLEEQTTKLAEVEGKLATERKSVFFDEMINTGRIAPAEREDFEALYEGAEDKVRTMLSGRKAESVVKLSETGSGSTELNELSGDEKFIQLAEQMVKEDNITFAEATLRVAAANPDLAGDE